MELFLEWLGNTTVTNVIGADVKIAVVRKDDNLLMAEPVNTGEVGAVYEVECAKPHIFFRVITKTSFVKSNELKYRGFSLKRRKPSSQSLDFCAFMSCKMSTVLAQGIKDIQAEEAEALAEEAKKHNLSPEEYAEYMLNDEVAYQADLVREAEEEKAEEARRMALAEDYKAKTIAEGKKAKEEILKFLNTVKINDRIYHYTTNEAGTVYKIDSDKLGYNIKFGKKATAFVPVDEALTEAANTMAVIFGKAKETVISTKKFKKLRAAVAAAERLGEQLFAKEASKTTYTPEFDFRSDRLTGAVKNADGCFELVDIEEPIDNSKKQ